MHVASFQVLLSQDELLQLSGVQCIAEVLTSHPDYGRVLLNADIAGMGYIAMHQCTDKMYPSNCFCLQNFCLKHYQAKMSSC